MIAVFMKNTVTIRIISIQHIACAINIYSYFWT
jgi:hypothetical protein